MAKRTASTVIKNRDSFSTGVKTVTSAGTAEQLSSTSVPVPDGFKIILVALPGNTGDIYFGNSQTNAQSTSARFDKLEAGDSIALQLTNLNLIWIDSSVDGEGASWYVEQ